MINCQFVGSVGEELKDSGEWEFMRVWEGGFRGSQFLDSLLCLVKSYCVCLDFSLSVSLDVC